MDQAALEHALWHRRGMSLDGLVHHSDAAKQYTAIRYGERLAEAGLQPSIGSVGDSFDNALAESANALAKRIKRVAFGLRSFVHWRISVLLYAGNPDWTLLPTVTP